MFRSTFPLALALTAAAAQPPAPGRGGRPAKTASPPRGTVAILADTAAVRRMCEQPDSVVAGRKTCVLRNQAAIVKIF